MSDTKLKKDEPDSDDKEETRNPLWVVAVGMACLFAVGALVLALS